MKKNAIKRIVMWKEGNTWMFDESEFGLVREPFVGATNRALDYIADDENEMTFLFSDHAFPNAIEFFTEPIEEFGGATFKCSRIADFCWLCSAMWHYFDELPASIFVTKE